MDRLVNRGPLLRHTRRGTAMTDGPGLIGRRPDKLELVPRRKTRVNIPIARLPHGLNLGTGKQQPVGPTFVLPAPPRAQVDCL